ncbi:MAG: DnaD domain protein, partial [Lacticaseibacillus paracasei]|nr:DnaD domain protein [Lacticaseibacillus paracasei]
LIYWVDDFKKIGSTDEQAVQVVKQAMSNAIDNNVRRYSYVNAILKNWESLRLTSLEAVTAYEAQRTQRQKSKSTSRQASTDVYQNQGDVQDEDLPW